MRISHQLLFVLLSSVVLQLVFLSKYLFPLSSISVSSEPSWFSSSSSSCRKRRTIDITNYRNYSISNDLQDLIRLPQPEVLLPNNPAFTATSQSICAFPSANSRRRHPILGSYYTWVEYYYEHFPHFMEYLYPCWSYWMARNSSQSEKILVLPANWATDRKRILRQSPYIQGILHVLEHHDIRVVSDRGNGSTFSSLAAVPIAVGCRLARIEDANSFRQVVMDSLGLPRRQQHCLPHHRPRIGILDRSTTRRLSNMHEIQKALQRWQGTHSNSTSPPPTIAYFEHKSFYDQMEWLSQHVDILVAPHGAGLTSIPLLPPCAGLVEIFPTGYDYRHFFGPLATTSLQRRHRVLYNGIGDFGNETKYAMQTASRRRKARSVPLCPDTDMVVQSVQELAEEWRQCACSSA